MPRNQQSRIQAKPRIGQYETEFDHENPDTHAWSHFTANVQYSHLQSVPTASIPYIPFY